MEPVRDSSEALAGRQAGVGQCALNPLHKLLSRGEIRSAVDTPTRSKRPACLRASLDQPSASSVRPIRRRSFCIPSCVKSRNTARLNPASRIYADSPVQENASRRHSPLHAEIIVATDTQIRKAMQAGRRMASNVVEQRTKVLSQRQAVVSGPARARAAAAPPSIKPQFFEAVGRDAPVGVLVAEGDSWFDYPFFDVLKLLEDDFGYDVRHVAHKGDRVEDMAYGGERGGASGGGAQLDRLTRLIEKLLRERRVPSAILLSGGGNDIAGSEFSMLLEHKLSQAAGLNPQVVSGLIDHRIRLSYVTILSAITRLCQLRTGKRIPILVHGYDYPVPDGRGYFGGWGFLPGPWLEPGFRQKGYENLAERTGIVRTLIDRFNAMLQELVRLQEFAHVAHVDLRGTLTTGSGYKDLWDNELHPTRKGFERVCAKIAKVLGELPAP